jgi:hypothetical protein
MPSPGPSVVTLGEQDPAFSSKSTPDEAARSAGPLVRQADPYRDIRRHLLAALTVIVVVAVTGSFLLLR